MPEKIILIDAYSLMFRAFHALPLLDNGQGVYTNAIHGFMSMLLKAITEFEPTYCAVAFDMHAPTFRHIQYPEYKAGRAPTPEEFKPQVELIKQLLSDMHIHQLGLEGFEADDILGTVSAWCEERGIQSLLITGDRDSFQLADDNTHILYTKRGISETELVTPEYIQQKYGVTPVQLIDVKGLMGDSSDNIPGIAGIGEKTALKLVQKYGSLENALDSADTGEKGKLRERLMNGRAQALESKALATIVRDAPVDFDLNACTIHDLQDGLPLIHELKLKTIATRIQQITGSEAPIENGNNAGIDWEKVQQFNSLDAFEAWLEKLNPKTLALHIGNSVSIADDSGQRANVPLGGDLLNPGFAEEDLLPLLKPLLKSPCTKIVYDFKKLLPVLTVQDIAPNGQVHDVMLAAYVLQPQRKKFDLSALLEDEGLVPEQDCLASSIYELARMQKPQMKDEHLTKLYLDIELPLAQVLYDMETEGFLIDLPTLEQLGNDYRQHIAELTDSITQLAGEPININSPKQLGELLFGKLGLPTGKKTTTGYSTSADVLEGLVNLHPIVAQILEYRRYAKLNSTYIEALTRLVDASGRVHTRFDQVSTATGRISSLDPNLQNIPVRTEQGREIRRAFIARPGWVLVDADYSQIELRVLAHMSGDPVMQEAFRLDQDIHQRTAAEVYGVPIDQVTPDMRSAAKAVNFGIVYGISEFGLARNIGITRAEAGRFINNYFERYPGVKKFMEAAVETGKKQGYITTLMGRRRYLPELRSSNYNTRSFGERAAMNSPIQGTAADIIKLAMVKVHQKLAENNFEARLILQVHDELIIETPEKEIQAVQTLLQQTMENIVELSVPLKVDVSYGRNWDDSK